MTMSIVKGIRGQRQMAGCGLCSAAACTLVVLAVVAGCGTPSTLGSARPASIDRTIPASPTPTASTSGDAATSASPSAAVTGAGSDGSVSRVDAATPGNSGGSDGLSVPPGAVAPPGSVTATGDGSGGQPGGPLRTSGEGQNAAPQQPSGEVRSPAGGDGRPGDAPQAPGGPQNSGPQPPSGGVGSPVGGNGSGPALASPIRVPLPTDSISNQPFEKAKSFLEPNIRKACGDGSLCVAVVPKPDASAVSGTDALCVGSAENTIVDPDSGGSAGTVTVPRNGTIFLLINAPCSDTVALAETNGEPFT